MVKYLCILLIYYLMPTMFNNTGAFIAYLLVITPALVFLCALFPSMKYGYELFFPIMCGILFIPAAMIHFNNTAYVYGILYGGIAFFGSVLGGRLKANFLNEKKKKQNNLS